jgi:transglutaminase/protease-like cytokinesis protein 3
VLSVATSFDDFYWKTPPEQFVYSHLPANPKWACVENPPSVREFGKALNLKGHFFASSLVLKSHKFVHRVYFFLSFA